MGLFKKNQGGSMDQIRCDEPSYLIWKWHPEGTDLGSGNRENAIRWGSSLRVKDGEIAVFVYHQNNGVMQDYIVGPFDEIIETKNFPVLASIVGLAYDGGTPFQAEVYFINLAQIIQVKFGVPYFDVYDPRFLDFGVPVAVRGTISFKITDYEEFIKLHRLSEFDLETFRVQIRDAVIRYVKDIVINAPSTNDIPVIQIESKISEITDVIEYNVGERLKEDFGVDVSGVDLSSLEIDKQSEGYRQLMAVTKDVTTATIKAQTEANVKNIHDKQRIEAENYLETLRIQREEGQYAQHKQTQSSNFAAYQVEAQTQVGVAGAEALGQMGANGAGDVNLGDSGVGMNPAAMMAGIALGGAVGQNLAGAVNGIMNGTNSQMNVTPPPIPATSYYVAIDGQPNGPYDVVTLKQMITEKKIMGNTLLWKQGMEEWKDAENIEEFKSLFDLNIPPIPNN